MKRLNLFLLCLLIPGIALAALKEPTIQWHDISFNGYAEGSYNYLLRKNVFTSDTYDRNFDLEPNGFTLQQFAITIANQPKNGVGFLVNPIMGFDANFMAPYGWNPYFGSYARKLCTAVN